MAEEIKAKSLSPDSADLTMTKEYLVVKGKHYHICNGYINQSEQPQTISVKNILSMEYLTMRSKRLFILFMVLMTIVACGGVGMRKLLSATAQLDRKMQKAEKVYNSIADEDIDVDITGSIIKTVFSSPGTKCIIAIYVVLILVSMGCLGVYLFRPFRVLFISSVGSIIAVEKKYYDKAQLNALIQSWKRQLQ